MNRSARLYNPASAAAAAHHSGRRALKDALNQALKDLKADGTIDRYAAKYFAMKVVMK